MSKGEILRAIEEQQTGIRLLECTIIPEDKKEEMITNANIAIEAMMYYLLHQRRRAGSPDFLSRGRNARFSGVFSFQSIVLRQNI